MTWLAHTSRASTPSAIQHANARSVPAVWRWLRVLLVAVPLLAAGILALPPTTAQAHGAGCQRHDAWVALTPGAHVRYRIAGWLCRPSRPTNVAQVLLSGFTYDHRYWDLGSGRSYARSALDAGTAVYTVDRIGVGLSDRPPADQVTAESEAYVAHQLVQHLRQGRDGYAKVVGVGHSYGSAVWMIEAATNHDIDAAVLTGYLHQANTAQQATIAASLHSAGQDDAFASARMPDGYVTTMPGTRGTAFYYTAGADPAVVAQDERTKATGTTGQRATMSLARDPSYSQHITAPVLIVVGDHDSLSCDDGHLPCRSATDVCARERGFYQPNAAVFAAVIPAAGHSINGHRTAPIAFAIANAWARSVTSGHGTFWPACRA